jgi:hypothetical protein
MIEQAPKSPKLNRDEAFLWVWTCSHNNKYDWQLPIRHDPSDGWDTWNAYKLNMFEHESSYEWMLWPITPVRDKQ